MRFMTSDQVTLVYSDHGSGQAIILLAGFGVPKEIWQAQVPALVAAGYRVISLDGRSHGQSERALKGQSLRRRATDVHELVTNLEIKKPILVGHSLGAGTCFAYIAQFGEQSITAIVDVDQPPQVLNTRHWRYGMKPIRWKKWRDYLARPWGAARFKAVDQTTSALVTAAESERPFQQWAMAPLLLDHLRHNWRPVLAGLHRPCLIIAGAASPLFQPQFAEVTAQMTDQGTAVVIPEVGHLVMAEQSAAFNHVLLSFLAHIRQV